MSSDLLLYWMSHRQEGSWDGFKGAVSELRPESSDRGANARRLRVALSDLGHVDFFVDNSARWRVLPPLIAGLAQNKAAAVLVGSRTPQLISLLQSSLNTTEARMASSTGPTGLTKIELLGDVSAIEHAAVVADIPFLPNASVRLIEELVPFSTHMEAAVKEEPPANWEAEHFDLKQRIWVKGVAINAACRFTPRNGRPMFLVHLRRDKFFHLPKREAVYASALLQGVSLLSYSSADSTLSVPMEAPLAEKLARIACFCSGAQPQIAAGALTYQSVPYEVAAAIFVAARQAPPEMQAVSRRRNVG